MADQSGNRAGAKGACGARVSGGADGASGARGAGGASGEPRTTDESELLTDVFLKKVADELGTENYQLGVLLHVKRPFITRMEADHHRNTWRVTFEILMKWSQTSTNRSDAILMVEELIVALTQLHLNDVADVVRLELVPLLKDRIKRMESRWQTRFKDCEDQLRQSEMKTKTAPEQTKLLKEELKEAKAEVESCRQKYVDDVRQLNEKVRLLKDEAQKTKVPATSPAIFPSASSEKERPERIRQLTKIATSGKPAKERALDVMRLLREYGEPQLWHEVSHHIVSNGQLDISGLITANNLPDLEFLLISASETTTTCSVGRRTWNVYVMVWQGWDN